MSGVSDASQQGGRAIKIYKGELHRKLTKKNVKRKKINFEKFENSA